MWIFVECGSCSGLVNLSCVKEISISQGSKLGWSLRFHQSDGYSPVCYPYISKKNAEEAFAFIESNLNIILSDNSSSKSLLQNCQSSNESMWIKTQNRLINLDAIKFAGISQKSEDKYVIYFPLANSQKTPTITFNSRAEAENALEKLIAQIGIDFRVPEIEV